MATLTDLARRPPPAAREAMVANPAVTPDGWLRVTIDAHRSAVHAVPWMPRTDTDPTPGDGALILESDAGTLWCIAWWPQ